MVVGIAKSGWARHIHKLISRSAGMAVSALIFMNELGISSWFNHYDISPILMCVSAFIFCRGSLKMIGDPMATIGFKLRIAGD